MKDFGRSRFGNYNPSACAVKSWDESGSVFILLTIVYGLLAGISAGSIDSIISKLIFPPVMCVMIWYRLSQQILKGSLISVMEIMPGNGTIEIIVQAPTWLTRFKKTISHGIPREGIYFHLGIPKPHRLLSLSFPN